MLSDDTIAQTLRRHADPQQAADTLVDMANQAGGDDNITVVLVDALSDGSEGSAATAIAQADAVPLAGGSGIPAGPGPDEAPEGPRGGPGGRGPLLLGVPLPRALRGPP